MPKVHLDTDLGGDIDDLCALAMLLRWEDVTLTGITTVAEAYGRRAGYVYHILELENRTDIPIAAGADVSQGFYRYRELGYPDEERYWSKPIATRPNPTEEALRLLEQSIEQGAVIIAIGPFTNLSLLERRHPGILKTAKLFLMGGYIYPIRPGFPRWNNDMDWNIQVDVKSAKHVIEESHPTLIPLSVTVETALRRACIKDLQTAGPMGRLLARHAEAFAEDEQNETKIGETCEALPGDIINFLHDPLACAIALGWNEGVKIEEIPVALDEKEGWLYERVDPAGRPVHVVTEINGRCFNEFWLNKIVKGKRTE